MPSALLAAVLAVLAVLAAPDQALDGDRVRILYPERLAGMARTVRERLPLRLREVEGQLGTRLEKPVFVRLAAGDDDFEALVGPGSARYAAVAYPARSEIVLKASAIQQDAPLPAIVRHELTHLVLHDLLRGQPVPRWFEEGLAEIVGGAFPVVTAEELPAAVAAGRVRPLDEIAERFPEDPRELSLAYRQSESFVRFLRAEAGVGGLRAVLQRVRDGGTLDDAILQAVGEDRLSLERRWREELEARHPFWLVLLRTRWIETLLCACALLAVVAFARYRWRRRRTLRDLEDDEEEADAG